MKRTMRLALLLCALCMGAAGEALPGVEVFSPGLVRVSEKLARGERVAMTATAGVTDMGYVRDVSVLSAMLEGTTFAYEGAGGVQKGTDALTIARGEAELFALGMTRDGDAAELTVNGTRYGVQLPGMADAGAAVDALSGAAILERVPLQSVCAAIEGLRAGDALAMGYAVSRPFAVTRTMSDDGTRLTRIEIDGEIARAGEAPYRVTGYLRQPGGRSPKDTFEIVLTQDEDNFIELSYSALRKSETTRKGAAGETETDTTLKAAGRLAGYSVTSRLRVIQRNSWTKTEDGLRERITVTATLGHTDKTPGRRMLRLNDLSAKLRCEMDLTSGEGSEVIGVDETITLSAVFDGNTFLDVCVQGDAQVGGSMEMPALTDAPAADGATLSAAFEDAATLLVQRLYPQLGEKAKEKLEKGL